MTEKARCKDCAHAKWELTPTGRIKAKYAGRCQADTGELPVLMSVLQPPAYRKIAIWPDYEGRCDFFRGKP